MPTPFPTIALGRVSALAHGSYLAMRLFGFRLWFTPALFWACHWLNRGFIKRVLKRRSVNDKGSTAPRAFPFRCSASPITGYRYLFVCQVKAAIASCLFETISICHLFSLPPYIASSGYFITEPTWLHIQSLASATAWSR